MKASIWVSFLEIHVDNLGFLAESLSYSVLINYKPIISFEPTTLGNPLSHFLLSLRMEYLLMCLDTFRKV